MTPFPLDLEGLMGHWESYIVYLAIGIAFGAVLEMAGFAQSTKLAAQFYFKDTTVLKVMFTAIVVAMILILLTSTLGLLDVNLIWINPTYLWPGILGGLIMGFGFIIGGFCPGTSIVAAGTLKLDGIMFALGVFFGIFLFGETVGNYEEFWYSSYYGRYTIQDMLGVDAGIVALGVVLMALFAFWGSEQLEHIFGGLDPKKTPKWRYYAAGMLVILAVGLVVLQQPSTEDRWHWIEAEQTARLKNREVQIHPAELLSLLHNNKVQVRMLDVRSESDFNLFHIREAEHLTQADIPDLLDEFRAVPGNTAFVVMSNDERAATAVWKILVAESVPNVYILEGGVNNWLATFTPADNVATTQLASFGDDQLGYSFPAALGARHPAANPNPDVFEDLEFEPKVKLQTKGGAKSGGCG
jgi:hypothetical protein